MYSVESFCETMMLNEALFGQKRETLELFAKELGVSFDFELRDIYLCLTGVSRQKNWGGFSLSRPQYQEILHPLVDELLEWAQGEGLWVRYAVMHYDLSKQICFLLKKTGQSGLEVGKFAETAARRFEEEYRKTGSYQAAGLANFTVVSDLVPDYDHLAEAFSDLCRMKRLSFFRMETGVFTKETLRVRPMETQEIYERAEQIGEMLQKEDPEGLEKAVRQLFSGGLKKSMDFEGCGTAVHELNRMAYKLCELLPPEEGGETWERLSVEDHASIEGLEQAALDTLRRLQRRVVRSGGRRRNPLTVRAVKWLMGHYMENVGLQEAATVLGVSPSYLSRTFSRDMGIPLSAYLSELRLEQAKRLLTTSGMKIAQVAEQSGFRDPEYFGTLFRKKTGLYPQKYREKYTELGSGEAEKE